MTALDILTTYLDGEGRVMRWPKRVDLPVVLAYVAEKFEVGKSYTEKEVNTILNQWHTFYDAAVLRREMFESGLMNREKNGASYWRTPETRLLS